jgi:hypothetical protein
MKPINSPKKLIHSTKGLTECQSLSLLRYAASLLKATRAKGAPLSGDQNGGAPLIDNERGSLLLGSTLILVIIALYASLTLKQLILVDEENHQRKQTYLCLKKTFDLWAQHQNFIERTNKSIYALQAAFTLKPNPVLLKMKKALQKWQELKRAMDWKKALTLSNCRGLQMTFIKKTYPIMISGLKIKRGLIGEALIKRKSQNFILPSKGKPPFYFLIKGTVRFSPIFQLVNSKEITLSKT